MKEEIEETAIHNAPSKIYLNLGDISGKIDFNDLKQLKWSISPKNAYDLDYIHVSIYERAYNQAKMYKNAFLGKKEALRDHKHLNKILIKYVARLTKLASLQELMASDKKYMDEMESDLIAIQKQLKDYE